MVKEIRATFNSKKEKIFYDTMKTLIKDSRVTESDFTKYCFIKTIINDDGKIKDIKELKDDIISMKISWYKGIFKLVGVPKIILNPNLLDSLSYFLNHKLNPIQEVKSGN